MKPGDPPRIPYRYKIPPTVQPDFRQVEAAIRTGDVLSTYAQDIHLGRLGDGGKRRPAMHVFICEIELSLTQHLFASFWPDPPYGIPTDYSVCLPGSHSGRHFVAFVASHVMRLHLCPVSAPRTHPKLGSGIMVANIAGQHCMMTDVHSEGRPTQILSHIKHTPSFAENILFNGIIGSGQRLEESLKCYKESCWSSFHPEAWAFTEEARLIEAFAGTPRRIRRTFWETLQTFSNDRLAQQKVEGIVSEFYGEKTLKEFTRGIDHLLATQRFGDEDVIIIG